jgi:hypothetical protein
MNFAKQTRQSGLSFPSDAMDFLFDGEFVQARKRQTQKQTDSAIKNHERVSERLFDLLGRARHRRRIRHAPMRRQRLAGPDRANFFGRVIAHRENKIELGRARPREFVPVFAPRASRGQTRNFKLPQRLRTNSPCCMAPRALRGEIRPAFAIHNRLGHDRARRIPGAQKQNVIVPLHRRVLDSF